MRYLIALLISCAPAFATEFNPGCYITSILLQFPSNPGLTNSLRVNGKDSGNTSQQYAITATMDGLYTLTITTSGGTAAFPMTSTAWSGTGGNPQDGFQHYFTTTMASVSHGTIVCNSDTPWPFKYLAGPAVGDNTRPLFTNSTGGTALNPSVNAGLVVNPNDTVSIGTTGSSICPNGSYQLFSTGTAYQIVQAYSVPCGNVIYCPTVTTQTMTTTQAAAMVSNCTTVSAAVTSLAVQWAQPNIITGISNTTTAGTVSQRLDVAAYLSYNLLNRTSNIILSDVVWQNPQTYQGTALVTNTFAFNAFTDARACCNLLPAAYFMGVVCPVGNQPNCFTGWTEDYAATIKLITDEQSGHHSDPTGGFIYNGVNSSAASASWPFTLQGPTLTGLNTGVAPSSLGVTVATLSNAGTNINQTNILSLTYPGNISYTSTGTFVHAGAGIMLCSISYSGSLQSDECTSGTPLKLGAIFSFGSIIEPIGIAPSRFPDMMAYMSAYTRGMTALEAYWKTTLWPWASSALGNPWAQPFSNTFNPSANPSTGGVPAGGSVRPNNMIGMLWPRKILAMLWQRKETR